MPTLKIYGQNIQSVFHLLGNKENDISYSIGWTLYQSDAFLKILVKRILGQEINTTENISIRLQSYQKERGYTDFEIECPGEFYLIIEAKRGWIFPLTEQLEKYEERKDFKDLDEKYKKIVVLTETTPEYTEKYFKTKKINGVEVIVLSYRELYKLLERSSLNASNIEKRLFEQLKLYLKSVTTMKDVHSNKVYVVALGADKPDFSTITWQEIVNKKGIYFHPVGGDKGRWPVEPPNYIAFRYNGQLQSIHYVESYTIFKNPNELGTEFKSEDWPPHFAYQLGKAIRPNKVIRTGKGIFRNGRVWCSLDLLLTCDRIDEARDRTKQREVNN